MTLNQFLEKYCFKFEILNQGKINLIVITKVIERQSNNVVDSVKTTIEIQETNNWISDSQSDISLIQWDWEMVIDRTKRFQLDFFAQRISIEDFLPLNTNSDIDKVYCNN